MDLRQMEYEVQMAEARHELEWDEQFRLALYGGHARKIHERDGETGTRPPHQMHIKKPLSLHHSTFV